MKSIIKLVTSAIKKASLTIMVVVTISSNVCAETLYYNGFETMTTGQANDSAVKSAWSTRYAKGPDEGRLSITSNGYLGKAGQILYPANSHSTSHSGGTWETDINASEDDLYLAYWIKLDENFQCVKGGKLPGFAGSESFPYGDTSWSARLMWREDCKLEWYLHDFALNTPQGDEPYRVLWDDFGEHARLIPGQWHHIELRVKLNTPGQLDGILQGWLDGIIVSNDWENSGVRGIGHGNVKVNQLFFSTFFGGSSTPVSQWQPKIDVYATFDEFVVSTTRIGEDGNTGNDGDNDGVINDIDICPDTPNGVSVDETGCQIIVKPNDDDNDGVENGLDQCPASKINATVDSTGCEVIVGKSCADVTEIAWKQKSEVVLTASKSCIRFDRDLSGKTLQFWDSDANSSCDFRGNVSSVDGAGIALVSSNYAVSKKLTGSTVQFTASNGCKFIKIRAY